MTRKRLLIAGTFVWLLIFGVLSQPHVSPMPAIYHARPLDPPNGNLPTLVP
jgi:hypothetical protein